ncbi:MAG: TauD/TfdA dioxygenase family protein [Steroidobacteraceae bacterium]
MSHETITVAPMTPRIGAVISGIDLTKPLEPRQVRDVRAALLAHGVIFFRAQPIDLPTHKALGRQFGELHVHSARKGLDEHPEVRPIHADADSKHIAGEEWHTDLSCDPIPPMGSILHLHTLPPIGGDTLFASMYAAYEALSSRMKTYLEGLTATHDGGIAFRRFDPNGKYPISVHAVVPRHPETKRPLLYVNRGFTSHINELPAAESAELLQLLYRHLEKPDFQVRFRWEPHSIAFWDNRCTQHLAVWDYYPNVRSGYRIQIRGSNPPFA